MLSLDQLFFICTFIAAVGCGLMGGIFFVFSNFIMKALDGLNPRYGIAAMQAINVSVLNPLFLVIFFGAAVLSIFTVLISLLQWHQEGSVYLLIGGVLYLAGSFLITIAFNVPRNQKLASVEPHSAEGIKYWEYYIGSWTFWNHIRTVSSLAASGLLMIAMMS